MVTDAAGKILPRLFHSLLFCLYDKPIKLTQRKKSFQAKNINMRIAQKKSNRRKGEKLLRRTERFPI
jgi:hypothetical protein